MYYEILETPVKMTASEASAKFPDKEIYIKYDIDYLRTLGDFDEPEGLVIALEDFDSPIKECEKLWDYIQGLDNNKYRIRQIHGINCYDSLNIITRKDWPRYGIVLST